MILQFETTAWSELKKETTHVALVAEQTAGQTVFITNVIKQARSCARLAGSPRRI